MPSETEELVEQRHATWLELFFDLVAVAGIGQLAHLLRGAPSTADVGLYVVLFLAFWTAWAGVMMYGNAALDVFHAPRMLLSMLALAIMAAAVPGVRHGHAVVLALAYVAVRQIADKAWERGQILVEWPVTQLTVGVLPWVASVFVGPPVRYWLWAAGVVLDLLIMFVVSGDRVLRNIEKRRQALADRHDINPERLPAVGGVEADLAHLSERLGLFVIIVLGEGVIEVISAAGNVDWDGTLVALASGAFVILVSMWALSLMYGSAGVPHLAADAFPAHTAMALHCFTTGAIAALAAGLGDAVGTSSHDLPDGGQWLLAASVATYFGISAAAGIATKADRRWLVGWALPCTVLPLAVGALGDRLGAVGVVWALAAVVAWQLVHESRAAAAAAAS